MVFFPLVLIFESRARFHVDPILLKTFSFYGLSPDQCLPNFYRVVNSVICLNNLYSLGLNHHDINFMYRICGGLKTGYYLKIRNPTVRLISCLPNSNRNFIEEFIKVSENWLAGELRLWFHYLLFLFLFYCSASFMIQCIRFLLTFHLY